MTAIATHGHKQTFRISAIPAATGNRLHQQARCTGALGDNLSAITLISHSAGRTAASPGVADKRQKATTCAGAVAGDRLGHHANGTTAQRCDAAFIFYRDITYFAGR